MRTDANQSRIVQHYRKRGATVEVLSSVGMGVPDLMVGYKFFTFLVETKVPAAELNQRQREWHAGWAGAVAVVHDENEADFTLRTFDALVEVIDGASKGQAYVDAARFIILCMMQSWAVKNPDEALEKFVPNGPRTGVEGTPEAKEN